jgi:hypothetical protein
MIYDFAQSTPSAEWWNFRKLGQRMQQFLCHFQYFLLVEEGFILNLSLDFDKDREQVTDWRLLMINK